MDGVSATCSKFQMFIDAKSLPDVPTGSVWGWFSSAFTSSMSFNLQSDPVQRDILNPHFADKETEVPRS